MQEPLWALLSRVPKLACTTRLCKQPALLFADVCNLAVLRPTKHAGVTNVTYNKPTVPMTWLRYVHRSTYLLPPLAQLGSFFG